VPSGLSIFLVLVVLYALFAAKLDRMSVSMPIVFVIFGAILGPHGLGILRNAPDWPIVELVVEMTLALLLFADAASISARQVAKDTALPARLLFLALPLSIVLGSVCALVIFPSEGLGFALLLGAILAPTDAALGLPIFTNEKIPLRVRRALNVESGLNDGIATPFVAVFSALALSLARPAHGSALVSALTEIAIAVVVATAVGLLGGWIFARAVRRRWTSGMAENIGCAALALAAYSSAVATGGNGFIAAFVGGLLFGFMTRGLIHKGTEFVETSGTLLSLLVWTVFGAYAVLPVLRVFDPLEILFALLALTAIRTMAVGLATLGTKMRVDTVVLMGWFGPRGLASVVFTLRAMEAFGGAGRPFDRLVGMAVWTILLSVFLHGVSALPLTRWYSKRLESAPRNIPELADVAHTGALRRTVASRHSGEIT